MDLAKPKIIQAFDGPQEPVDIDGFRLELRLLQPVRLRLTIPRQVSAPAGQPLYGPDKNEKYYYSGSGITLYTSDGVLVAGPVVPDETGASGSPESC